MLMALYTLRPTNYLVKKCIFAPPFSRVVERERVGLVRFQVCPCGVISKCLTLLITRPYDKDHHADFAGPSPSPSSPRGDRVGAGLRIKRNHPKFLAR